MDGREKEHAPVAQIHPTAVVDSRAELGTNVTIGPFCVVEADVRIGDDCRLEARSVVKSRTTLGVNNEVGEGVVLGAKAQHLVETQPGGVLIIGNHNRIRENSTFHRGHANDAATIVGDHNLMMVNAHVGHDVRVGNNCVLVNNSMIGGHCRLDDRAYISGGVGVHQFCRVGRLAMVGALAKIVQDVPPFMMVEGGGSTEIVGLNRVGLRRNGYTPDQILQLKQAYRVIYRQGLRWSEVLQILKAEFSSGPAAEFLEFLKAGKRGFVQERRISRKATLKIANTEDDEDIEESGTQQREAA
jgi:UDP-N-acetylglucosamine acyltransferase